MLRAKGVHRHAQSPPKLWRLSDSQRCSDVICNSSPDVTGVTYSNMCEAGCAGARVSQHVACSMLDDGGKPAGDDSDVTIIEHQKTCVECVKAGRSWQVGQVRVWFDKSYLCQLAAPFPPHRMLPRFHHPCRSFVYATPRSFGHSRASCPRSEPQWWELSSPGRHQLSHRPFCVLCFVFFGGGVDLFSATRR